MYLRRNSEHYVAAQRVLPKMTILVLLEKCSKSLENNYFSENCWKCLTYNELKFLFKIYDDEPQNFFASGRIHLQINLQQSQL